MNALCVLLLLGLGVAVVLILWGLAETVAALRRHAPPAETIHQIGAVGRYQIDRTSDTFRRQVYDLTRRR